MKLSMIILFFVSLSFHGYSQSTELRVANIAKDVDAKQFTKLMNDHPGLILDVRTKGEVAKGAIKNSINIDLFSDSFEAEIDKIDKTKPVYVYCASGGRSGEAMEMMNKKGFKEVYNLEGGYMSWKKTQENTTVK